MHQVTATLDLQAPRQGLHDFTNECSRWVANTGIAEGLLTLFCRHSSASLLIQENAAPAARSDLEAYFTRIAPESADYAHNDEGADDMPAHLRTALTTVHLAIPVQQGRMMLGTWQGVYLFEHRREPPRRQVVLHLVGE
ncbi:MAG TPA: secondary thiamine-phosphate synthase enzyme YjbQ [Sphingomicrobium sp.]|jgi:secondary thiamine-phosphate synthase enzyme